MKHQLVRNLAVRALAAALLSVVSAASVAAQTLNLTDSNATVLRGGAYANTNYSADPKLATRASSDPAYVRRIVLKFDTHNTIPAGTSIASAVLTLTVAGGNAESRQLAAYRVSTSYDEWTATWTRRKSSTTWSSGGGDLAERYAVAAVSANAGSRVSFDVTGLVQKAVSGSFGSSRYSRLAIVDTGASSRGSYKEFYSDEAGDVTVRPTLTVVFGSAPVVSQPVASEPAPAPSTTSTTTGVRLRVLEWNLHHGVGTDGKYNIERIANWIVKMTPDVVLLNEVEKYTGWGYEDQPARYKSMLQSKTGKTWYAHFTQEFGDWNSNGKGHLILSKYPFQSTSRAETTPSDGLRGAGAVGQATIIVNGRTVNLFVAHLDPYDKSMRLIQARDVIRYAAGFAENRILAGDMNAWPDQTSIAELNKTYYDSWTIAESKGTALSFPGLTPSGATKKGRIDYIFYSRTASQLVVRSSQVYDTRDVNGVMPSDHRPVLTTFEVR